MEMEMCFLLTDRSLDMPIRPASFCQLTCGYYDVLAAAKRLFVLEGPPPGWKGYLWLVIETLPRERHHVLLSFGEGIGRHLLERGQFVKQRKIFRGLWESLTDL